LSDLILQHQVLRVADSAMVVHYHSETQEPYLRLPEPHANIIITPHRPNSLHKTSSALAKILNDPRVALRLQRTPFPYSKSDGEEWVKANCKDQQDILSILRKELEEPQVSGDIFHQKRQPFDVCPFTCIREVLKTEAEAVDPLEDILIGDIRLARSGFDEYPEGSQERTEVQKRNEELLAGDGNIEWSLAGTKKLIAKRYPDDSCTDRYQL
jgi:hypothetical protein